MVRGCAPQYHRPRSGARPCGVSTTSGRGAIGSGAVPPGETEHTTRQGVMVKGFYDELWEIFHNPSGWAVDIVAVAGLRL